MVDALKNRYPLLGLLSKLKISKSSYYYQESCWTIVQCLKSVDKYKDIRNKIIDLFNANKKCYGYRRIYGMLKKEGITVSEKIVRRKMHEENLEVKSKRRKKYNSYKGEITPPVPNIIQRDFHADKPNEKWLTDITEFAIPAGKVYLSPIVDCFDGLLTAWTINIIPDPVLINSMLDQATIKLSNDEHPIVHSDRGCHYRWPGWIERMKRAGLYRSMSKKGCSPDNSACEGLFGRVKNELFYNRDWNGVKIPEFISILNDYLVLYNEKRIKISLGNMSPMEYRKSLGLAA